MRFFRRRRVAPVRVTERRALFTFRVHLLPTSEGGRLEPVMSGYRPQLFIGQHFLDGTRSEWDCEWTFDSPVQLNPGDEGVVEARLMGLPDGALLSGHRVEFYEGPRKVATGHVVSVQRPAEAIDGGDSDPLVFVMRNAFDGAVITSVVHEADGDWQFLTGPATSPDQAQLVHLSHVMSLDPALEELRDLPIGHWAHRHAAGEPWQVEVDSD